MLSVLRWADNPVPDGWLSCGESYPVSARKRRNLIDALEEAAATTRTVYPAAAAVVGYFCR
jgi:hypothetical protein